VNEKQIEMITYGVAGDVPTPRGLSECIAEFSRVLAAVPSEYRDSTEIDFEPHWEYGESYSQVRIYYERPMTLDELAADTEEMRAHWMEQLREARSRIDYCNAELERLASLDNTAPTSVGAA
jgi:hypothetical protein